jgi:hypothetical protein
MAQDGQRELISPGVGLDLELLNRLVLPSQQ